MCIRDRECVVHYPGPKGFAGTSDLIGIWDNIPSVIDFKQKNSIMKESYDSLQTYFIQLGAYSLAHNTVYGSSITQGVILLATTDLVFQVFRINNEKLIEYQNKFLDKENLVSVFRRLQRNGRLAGFFN